MHRSLAVYIIRHGETNENRLGIIQGQMDTQLNDAGRAQAKLTGRVLKGVNFIRAYSSDSTRAADTAQAITAYHPKCELVLDARLRERYMGSLSGTKAPARRPLPPDIETVESINTRLRHFWENAIIPLLLASPPESPNVPSTSQGASAGRGSAPQQVNSRVFEIPAVLIVSHGATISKLIRDLLLRGYGYATACEVARRGIYNTSISVLRMDAHEVTPQDPSNRDSKRSGESIRPLFSVSGELLAFASISHLIQKKEVVKENADMLEQRNS